MVNDKTTGTLKPGRGVSNSNKCIPGQATLHRTAAPLMAVIFDCGQRNSSLWCGSRAHLKVLAEEPLWKEQGPHKLALCTSHCHF